MSRPIIQVHTIDQWLQLNEETKLLILRNIKLKDRLYKWLLNRPKDPTLMRAPDGDLYAACKTCDRTGWEYIRERKPGIHPSQLPHPCMLKIYNEMIGVPGVRKIEAKMQLVFDLGHAVHRMFQNYGLDGAWGPIYTPEVELAPQFQDLAQQFMIEGSADGDGILTIDDIPDHPFIYEVGLVHEYKTMNTRNFEGLTRPKPEHQKQASIYSEALNRPVVVYIYFNKNDQNLADFPVPYERSQWAVMGQKAQSLVNAYHAETPPPAEPGYHCQECEYALSCRQYAEYSAAKRSRRSS